MPQPQQESTGSKQGGDGKECQHRLDLRTFFDLQGGSLLDTTGRIDSGLQPLELRRKSLLSVANRVGLGLELRELLREIPERGLRLGVGLDATG